jgi:hypothetical protein
MTLPRRKALLFSLALLIFAGVGMIICKRFTQGNTPYLCYADKGYMLSNRSCLQIDDYSPITKDEAEEYAQDLAMLLIDSRLHSNSCEPIRIETDEVKLGWRIRLYLPNSQDQWVDITVGRTNGLGSIKSHGPHLRAHLVRPLSPNKLCRRAFTKLNTPKVTRIVLPLMPQWTWLESLEIQWPASTRAVSRKMRMAIGMWSLSTWTAQRQPGQSVYLQTITF